LLGFDYKISSIQYKILFIPLLRIHRALALNRFGTGFRPPQPRIISPTGRSMGLLSPLFDFGEQVGGGGRRGDFYNSTILSAESRRNRFKIKHSCPKYRL